MRKALEKLWNEYFAEECAVINTEDEKTLVKKAGEMRKEANELLTKEQSEAIEKYIEALYKIQSCFVKKAFFKGCEFAASFFFEAGNFGKNKTSSGEVPGEASKGQEDLDDADVNNIILSYYEAYLKQQNQDGSN